MFSWFKTKSPSQPASPRVPVNTSPSIPPHPIAPSEVLSGQPPVSVVAVAGIRRDEQLIPKLCDDHRLLLALFGHIKASALAGEWPRVHSGLVDFSRKLTDHLLVESIKLYTYLKQQHRVDKDATESIQKFAAEMTVLGKSVQAVLDHYRSVMDNPALRQGFVQDWQALGQALGERIKREEEILYPLY